ncbi:hypothetical protein D3C80_1216990 [compost metagenome]
MGIGAGTETQLVGMGRDADIDRQHPELAQKLENACLGAERQGDDQHIEFRQTGEFHQFRKGAKLRITGDNLGRALALPVVENPADTDIIVRLLLQRADEVSGRIAAADDDGAAFHHAVAAPVANGEAEQQPTGENGNRAYRVPYAECRPGMQGLREKEEKETGGANEGQADGALNAGEHLQRRPQRRQLVAIARLQQENAEGRTQHAAAENRKKDFEPAIGGNAVDDGGNDHEHREFQQPQLPDHHIRRMVAGTQLVGDLSCKRIEDDGFGCRKLTGFVLGDFLAQRRQIELRSFLVSLGHCFSPHPPAPRPENQT